MYFPDFKYYTLKETPWLQELIREKLDPKEVFQRDGYNIEDVINVFIANEEAGLMYFLGSPSAKFCYRLYYPNPKVVEPHIIGDVTYLRHFSKLTIDFMFVKNEIEKINVYTHIPVIARLMVRFGFKEEGLLTDTCLSQGKLLDLKILGLKKQDYNNKRINKI